LLESATAFAHYYQRHINIFSKGLKWKVRYPIEPDALLRVLMTYSVAFSHRFIKAAQDLCHNILRVYAEQGKIEVTAPKYRGFHVRPSTLVAKIIMHYGSRVIMMLEKEVYDASRPLELFRANELINAKKRKFIAEQIAKLATVQYFAGQGTADLTDGLRQVWIELLKNHKIVVYDQDFTNNQLEPFEDETLAEYAKRWVAHSLALGKIDIDTDIYVTFVGDKRVLEDIRQLVEFGYGEDKYGNNLVLPSKLSYLKR
jgi:phosphotransferase system HPr-like phosphotransfer protein